MARTYESALSHLAALQSNRAITSLFSPPPNPTPSSTSSSGAGAGASSVKKPDLNALAIPEMLAWLQRAGLSQDDLAASKLRCIHVAGTKGKGSVCAYLTALLAKSEDGEARALAGKVGTYTSPHLVSVRERIAIDGVPISQDLFARYFFEVWDACTEAARAELAAQRAAAEGNRNSEMVGMEISEEELQGPATKPFYFRFLTIVALRAFIGEGVRSAVVECGIGGEYDSTNVLPPASVTASVVTQLGIDHVGMLGGTLPEIAWHKAGVCKPGRKCYTRHLTTAAAVDQGTEASEIAEKTMQVLRQRARDKGATLVEVEDADVERWGGVKASDKGAGSLEGEFQKYNQALAVLAAREHLRVLKSESSAATGSEQMETESLGEVPSTFTSALQRARLRGRCETHDDEQAPVTWLIDGAHTAESLTEVARWYSGKMKIAQAQAERILLFNQQERDAGRLVTGLIRDIEKNAPSQQTPLFTHAIFTRNDLLPRTRKDGDGDAETETELEPERDLSVQQAAAEALRNISPETSTIVLDNVADAVARVRALALADSDGNGNGNGEGRRRTTVLVTGSLHLVGALLRTLEPDAAL